MQTMTLFFNNAPALINGAVSAAQTINRVLRNDSNFAKIKAIIEIRAGSSEESAINTYLEKIKQKGGSISSEHFSTIHTEFKRQQSYLNNHSAQSETMWELENAADLDDKQRAESIINFMCNKENWIRSSCKFLWQNYTENKLFDINLNADNNSVTDAAKEPEPEPPSLTLSRS